MKVEKFLNLKPFFQKGHFIFDDEKGFYCMNRNLNSTQAKCMKSTKGRTHPNIMPNILQQLRRYYEPYDKELFNFINEKPFW